MTDPAYPLFPELSESGKAEAVRLIEQFKAELRKAASTIAEEAIVSLYCDVLPHIESDSWGNFRRELLDGLCDYGNRTVQGEHDFAKIRRAIFEQYRSEIIADLNQDHLKRIAELEADVLRLRDMLDRRHGVFP
jgi:hypothetical protein